MCDKWVNTPWVDGCIGVLARQQATEKAYTEGLVAYRQKTQALAGGGTATRSCHLNHRRVLSHNSCTGIRRRRSWQTLQGRPTCTLTRLGVWRHTLPNAKENWQGASARTPRPPRSQGRLRVRLRLSPESLRPLRPLPGHNYNLYGLYSDVARYYIRQLLLGLKEVLGS